LIQTEPQSFKTRSSQQQKKHEEVLEDLRSKHHQELQELASRLGSLEAAKASQQRDYKALQAQVAQVKEESSQELKRLEGVKEGLEDELKPWTNPTWSSKI
jgi:predicted  nucleic acid-binding Zn-ribbon protein